MESVSKLLISLFLFLSACTFSPPERSVNVSLYIPEVTENANFAIPTSAADVDCYVVSVAGPGIPAYFSDHHNDFSQLIATGDRCVAPSITTAPSLGGDVNVSVPSGPNRILQVLGIKVNTSAPFNPCTMNKPFVEIIDYADSQSIHIEDLMNIYVVGHTVRDIFFDQTIEVPNVYSATNYIDLVECLDDEGGEEEFGPNSINGLKMWVNAESASHFNCGGTCTHLSAIDQWFSDDANGNHFTQATTASKPLLYIPGGGVRNYVHFDGTDDFFRSTTTDILSSSQAGLTAIIVLSYDSLSGSTDELRTPFSITEKTAGTYATDAFLYQISQGASNQQQVRVRRVTSPANNVDAIDSTPPGANTVYIMSMVWSNSSVSNTVRLYRNGGSGNGNPSASGTWGSSDAMLLDGYVGLGCSVGFGQTCANVVANPGARLFQGKIYEFILYDREIGDNDRFKLECDLGSYYGVSVSNPDCP